MAHGFKNEPNWKPYEHEERDAPRNDLGTLSMSASWSFFKHGLKMRFGVGVFQRRSTPSPLLDPKRTLQATVLGRNSPLASPPSTVADGLWASRKH